MWDKIFDLQNTFLEKLEKVMKGNKARLLISFWYKFFLNLKTYRYLQLTVKIFTQIKLTDVLYCLLLYFPYFQEDILWIKKVILHQLLQEFGHGSGLSMVLSLRVKLGSGPKIF